MQFIEYGGDHLDALMDLDAKNRRAQNRSEGEGGEGEGGNGSRDDERGQPGTDHMVNMHEDVLKRSKAYF